MEEFNPQDELLYIKKVIEDSKRNIIDDGRDLILWGVIVVVGLVSTYLSFATRSYLPMQIIWIFLGTLGWTLSYIFHRNQEKKVRVKNFATKVLNSIWVACGLALTIFIFTGMFFQVYPPIFISPLACIILGVGYYATGVVVSLKWMQALSIGWWGGALYMLFFPTNETILVLAGMMFFFQTVPGIIIYRKCKKEAAINGEA